jgi:hypothetical protein
MECRWSPEHRQLRLKVECLPMNRPAWVVREWLVGENRHGETLSPEECYVAFRESVTKAWGRIQTHLDWTRAVCIEIPTFTESEWEALYQGHAFCYDRVGAL